MAKKIRNLLLFGAAIGATAAGVYYYLNKSDRDFFDEEDEDFDDFDDFELDDEEDEEEKTSSRKYVTLNRDNSSASSDEDTPYVLGKAFFRSVMI